MARTKKVIHNFWTKIKPNFNEECILITASSWRKGQDWRYTMFEIKKTEIDGKWYMGVFQDGDEWGDLADISADLYYTMKLLNPKK